MSQVDLSGLSPLSKVAMGLMVVSMILCLNGWLNLMGLQFKGMDFLNALFGPTGHGQLYVGAPTLIVAAILFNLGGGKKYLEEQKRKNG